MVKEVVAAEPSSAGDLNKMLNLVRTRLALEKVVIVTTAFDGSRALVRSELIETSTGKRVGLRVHDTFDRRELESKIGSMVYAVLPPAGKGAKTKR
jgi:hypothetical protein